MARLYGRRWGKARAEFLAENPYCRYCEGEGRMFVRATVVDHIRPHRNDPVLFWDVDNWQPLCELHHNAAKQAEEKNGRTIGCTVDGVPIDPDHHWSE